MRLFGGCFGGEMQSYRVFISYSHEDIDFVRSLVRTLEENGLSPMWDQSLSFGQGFDEQIRSFIAFSHIFLPVLTPSSSSRGWVHQEIGYAMALRIPVLPVCRGQIPGEMIQMLHGVAADGDQGSLGELLCHDLFEDLVSQAAQQSRPLSESAMEPEDRSLLLAQYADQVRQICKGRSGVDRLVRQKAALGSFCVPDKHLNHSAWRVREGALPRSTYRRDCQLRERKALEGHVEAGGCRLILNPWLDYDASHGPGATRSRLQTLLGLLESDAIPSDKVEIAIQPKGAPHSLTILGDWFLAEAVSGTMGVGYQQTIFTRHAPTVRSRLEAFDGEFIDLLEEAGTAVGESRDVAIGILEERMEQVSAVPSERSSLEPD